MNVSVRASWNHSGGDHRTHRSGVRRMRTAVAFASVAAVICAMALTGMSEVAICFTAFFGFMFALGTIEGVD